MQKNHLLFLIYAGIAALIGGICTGFNVAPRFTSQLVALLVIVIVFMASEQWITHDAAEFENRFWTLMAFILSTTLLMCEDSPIKFPKEREGIAWCIVCLFSYVAHNYDRHLRRTVLAKRSNIPKPPSVEFTSNEERDAKVALLKSHVDAIDLRWMSSFFLNILFLSRVLHAESSIVHFFRDLTKDELNWFMRHVPIALILYKVKDHKIAGRSHRSQLLALLAKERVFELDLHSKAFLLDALQRLKLTAHPLIAYYVKNIIFSTKGDELSELKCMTDAKGDINSMHKLIFSDIRNSDTRAEILQYIMKQANIQAAHQLIRSKAGKKRVKFAWRKILSDIDDTLTCSGGSWPKGMDTSYPKHVLYPGVVAFYRELDLGVNGEDEWDPKHRVSNLVFLSARPHVYKDVSEAMAYSQFDNLRTNHGLHCNPSLLAGSLESGGEFMARGNLEPLAKTKYQKFVEYIQLYPEFQCIFIGDNGQGDVRAAEMLLTNELYRQNLCRTYVHIVQPLQKTFVQSKENCVTRTTAVRLNRAEYEKTEWQNPFPAKSTTGNRAYSCYSSVSAATRLSTSISSSSSSVSGNGNGSHSKPSSSICYFNTYIEAAIDAYVHKHIRISGLRRIMVESKKAFEVIKEEEWLSIAPEHVDIDYVLHTIVRPLKVEKNFSKTREKWVRVLSSVEASKAIVSNVASKSGGKQEITTTMTLSSLLGTPSRKPPSNPVVSTTTPSNSATLEVRDRRPSWSLPGSGMVEEIVKKIRSNSFTNDETVATPPAPALSPVTPVCKQIGPVREEQAPVPMLDAAAAQDDSGSANELPLLSVSELKNDKDDVMNTCVPLVSTIAAYTATSSAGSNTTNAKTAAAPGANKKSTVGKKINGLIQRELRIRELNTSIEDGNILLASQHLESVSLMPYPRIHKVGRIVVTPFGTGSIVKHRAEDGIYEICVPPPTASIGIVGIAGGEEVKGGIRMFVPGYQLYE